MGYHTDLYGTLKLNKQLTVDDKTFLEKLAGTRRMARNVDSKYGVDGEFYVDGGGMMGQAHEDNIIDYNRPPQTQPSLWLQWVPTEDGWGIEWDQNEKFYSYIEWLEYLIEKILAPKGYILNGEVEWSGEEDDDRGRIIVKDNTVTVKEGRTTYDEDGTKLFFVTDSVEDNEELHETLEQAEAFEVGDMSTKRIRICMVNNAYRDGNGWNYDDKSNTFETIKEL